MSFTNQERVTFSEVCLIFASVKTCNSNDFLWAVQASREFSSLKYTFRHFQPFLNSRKIRLTVTHNWNKMSMRNNLSMLYFILIYRGGPLSMHIQLHEQFMFSFKCCLSYRYNVAALLTTVFTIWDVKTSIRGVIVSHRVAVAAQQFVSVVILIQST